MVQPVINMKKSVATRHNINADNIYVLILAGANIPNGKIKEHVRFVAEAAKAFQGVPMSHLARVSEPS